MNATAEAPPSSMGRAAAQIENEIINGLQQTVSASRLTLFLQCRLKFYFRYVLAIPKPKPPALHVGNTVHDVLKAWHKARWLAGHSPSSSFTTPFNMFGIIPAMRSRWTGRTKMRRPPS